MRKLFTLAAASVLFLGLTSTAVGAPVEVVYTLNALTGTASYVPTPGGAGSGNAGGTMTIVYTSGSTTLGGSLGTIGTMKGLQLMLITPATILTGAFTIPAIAAGNRAVGNRTAGGVGAFGGATYVPAGYFSPAQPAISGTGNLNFNPNGSIGIVLAGAGNQVIGFPFAWTLSGITGQEVSRTIVPDPDGDGITDVLDKCQVVANGPLGGICYSARIQTDDDGDGFGNPCDGDFSQDGAVNSSDVVIFYADLATGVPTPGTGTDMNCDGAVNSSDVVLFNPQISQGFPGP